VEPEQQDKVTEVATTVVLITLVVEVVPEPQVLMEQIHQMVEQVY
jgi:hypothetical protein